MQPPNSVEQGMQKLAIRRVDEENCDQFVVLIEKLAEFEKLGPPDDSAKMRLRNDALEQRFNAYLGMYAGKPAAYLIFYYTYSSILARPVLFIEDLFVLEKFRGRGIGKKLFSFCIQEAKRNKCGRMEWIALDWNIKAHEFYKTLGARQLNEWIIFRLTEDNLANLSSP